MLVVGTVGYVTTVAVGSLATKAATYGVAFTINPLVVGAVVGLGAGITWFLYR